MARLKGSFAIKLIVTAEQASAFCATLPKNTPVELEKKYAPFFPEIALTQSGKAIQPKTAACESKADDDDNSLVIETF